MPEVRLINDTKHTWGSSSLIAPPRMNDERVELSRCWDCELVMYIDTPVHNFHHILVISLFVVTKPSDKLAQVWQQPNVGF